MWASFSFFVLFSFLKLKCFRNIRIYKSFSFYTKKKKCAKNWKKIHAHKNVFFFLLKKGISHNHSIHSDHMSCYSVIQHPKKNSTSYISNGQQNSAVRNCNKVNPFFFYSLTWHQYSAVHWFKSISLLNFFKNSFTISSFYSLVKIHSSQWSVGRKMKAEEREVYRNSLKIEIS